MIKKLNINVQKLIGNITVLSQYSKAQDTTETLFQEMLF